MLYLTQNNGRTIECNGWDDVKKNLSVYVSPNELLQAQSMIKAGCDQWNFVHGFCVDTLTVSASGGKKCGPIKTNMRTVTLTLPQHWMAALINLDLSGYDDDDIDQLELFTHYMRKTYGTAIPLDYDPESGNFMTWHDAREFGVLACDVYEVTFPITKQGAADGV